MFLVLSSSFLLDSKALSNFWYCLSAALVWFFNSLPDKEYSNLLIAEAFYSKSFSVYTSLPVKNSNLLTFPDDKAAISAVCLSKLYCALFCSMLLLISFIFSRILIFYKFFNEIIYYLFEFFFARSFHHKIMC